MSAILTPARSIIDYFERVSAAGKEDQPHRALLMTAFDCGELDETFSRVVSSQRNHLNLIENFIEKYEGTQAAKSIFESSVKSVSWCFTWGGLGNAFKNCQQRFASAESGLIFLENAMMSSISAWRVDEDLVGGYISDLESLSNKMYIEFEGDSSYLEIIYLLNDAIAALRNLSVVGPPAAHDSLALVVGATIRLPQKGRSGSLSTIATVCASIMVGLASFNEAVSTVGDALENAQKMYGYVSENVRVSVPLLEDLRASKSTEQPDH